MTDSSHFCYGCFQKTDRDPCPFCGYRRNTPQHSASCLSQGTVLNGQYLLGKTLGQGGFGITYLGYDMNLDFKVAIKEYMPEGLVTRTMGSSLVSVYSGDKQEFFDFGVAKFLEEARILARFTANPNIVSVRTFFKENGTAYFVMDYIEGMSLKEYLRSKGGKISFEEALRLMNPVMEALEDVHQKGLLHRDISPDNIYITHDGAVRLLDFGAARYNLNEHSKSLSVILKPGFAPEEQYRSRGKQGPWTDVYSLAATFYELIAGKLPPEALDRIHEDDLVLPSALGISLPEDAEKALAKALAVFASDRIQSMRELRDALNGRTALAAQTVAIPEKAVEKPASVIELPVGQTVAAAVDIEKTAAIDLSPEKTVVIEIEKTVAADSSIDKTAAVEPEIKKTVAAGAETGKTVAIDSSIGKTIAVGAKPEKTADGKPDFRKQLAVFFAAPARKIAAIAAGAVVVTGIAALCIVLGTNALKPSTTDLDARSGSRSSLSARASSSESEDLSGALSEDRSDSSSVSEPVSGSSSAAGSSAVSHSGKPSPSSSVSSTASSSVAPATVIGNATGNLVNYGIAAMQGEWIYYANTSGTRIRKMKLDGSAAQDVAAVNYAQSLNVVGDWIYFANGSDSLYIYKVRTDGSGLVKLCSVSAEELLVVNDWIYYNDPSGRQLHRMKTDGTSQSVIAENVDYCTFNYLDGNLYYSDSSQSNYLLKKPADGSGGATVAASINTLMTCFAQKTLYVNSFDYGLYKIGSGGEQTKICAFESNTFNIAGNWIYYNDASDAMCLYRMDLNGSSGSRQKLTSARAFCPSIVGNWIFFQYDPDDAYNYRYYRMHLDGSGLQPAD